MPAGSLLALLDDITTVLDDVSLMTQMAAKKTAGVLGDDLALNAQQVAGIAAERELPVVWAVAKGSFRNKLILVPAALAVSAFAPWAVTPLLMVGGAYLCFEGFEKLAHRFLHSAGEDHVEHAELMQAVADPSVDMLAFERDKIVGAVRTDFVLSAEIIVIALGTVASAPFMQQLSVLSAVAILMTVGVYGFVAAIVKLDDAGFYLSAKSSSAARAFGRALLVAAPALMKFLSVAGTVAMFMVGGGIVMHGVPALGHVGHALGAWGASVATVGPLLHVLLPLLCDALAGVVTGALTLACVTLATRVVALLRGRF
ncbi:MAG: DUF808 domain-containing protein [Gammaproteobacteria bacterium]|nr:DUF808 domain-containing protein [Gammaproteobacteria bacterium]